MTPLEPVAFLLGTLVSLPSNSGFKRGLIDDRQEKCAGGFGDFFGSFVNG